MPPRRGIGSPYPNYLRAERIAAGIATQEELAQKAGLESSMYSRIESGRMLAGPAELDAIVKALGVPAKRLYDRPYLIAVNAARAAARA